MRKKSRFYNYYFSHFSSIIDNIAGIYSKFIIFCKLSENEVDV